MTAHARQTSLKRPLGNARRPGLVRQSPALAHNADSPICRSSCIGVADYAALEDD